MKYISVAEAIDAPGLRLVLSAGVPGPWGESAKALLAFKGLKYQAVLQDGGGENAELLAWTGQTSAPVLVSDDLPAACHWLDLLMLAERLNPTPALLPEDPAQRASAIGLCALIAGVDGFGWARRMSMMEPMMKLDPVPRLAQRMAHKYGYTAEAFAAAPAKMRAICDALDEHLSLQAGDYFCGEELTAVDFYWANFAGMIKPLPHDLNPMPEWFRPIYTPTDSEILACLSPRLEAHRDMMYERHIDTPLDF
ncbi:MAG: glutathione S-transferase C-terminal domain-containing protein [Halioglobus sp.]